jgi:hypothetical protein
MPTGHYGSLCRRNEGLLRREERREAMDACLEEAKAKPEKMKIILQYMKAEEDVSVEGLDPFKKDEDTTSSVRAGDVRAMASLRRSCSKEGKTENLD